MIGSIATIARRELSGMSIRSQILLLLVSSQILAHAITIFVISGVLVGEDRKDQLRVDISDVFIGVLRTIDPAQSASDSFAIASLVRDDTRFTTGMFESDAQPSMDREEDLVRAELPDAWRPFVHATPQPRELQFAGPRIEPFSLVAELSDGTALWFRPSPNVVARTIPLVAATMTLMLVGVPLALLAMWAGAYLVAPVARLSSGVAQFAEDAQTNLLDESGPKEVRKAIKTFNVMQGRLRELIDDRAQTLAAIGHDMRTPLTRLRLRLEEVDLGDAAEGTQRDIEGLEAMIDDALEFLRSESKSVELGPVNVTSLCETAVSEFADCGKAVELIGERQINVTCDIALTLRALNNVLENALKYAGTATVSLMESTSDNLVEIVVADQGPGIPDEMMSLVQKPFNRLPVVEAGAEDAPRGFGLGLAIAVECMERQGGRLALSNNKPVGLTVSLGLPRDRRNEL
ncbi:MAG: HAMP domain-containing sensor histidine kinase [Rhodobacter sp.]|nr:HAMP domain-containing sensor histidine kinase [Rhodobacter sp.]